MGNATSVDPWDAFPRKRGRDRERNKKPAAACAEREAKCCVVDDGAAKWQDGFHAPASLLLYNKRMARCEKDTLRCIFVLRRLCESTSFKPCHRKYFDSQNPSEVNKYFSPRQGMNCD